MPYIGHHIYYQLCTSSKVCSAREREIWYCLCVVPSLKIVVAPLDVAVFTERMSCGYDGMYNASHGVVLRRRSLPSIRHTSTSHPGLASS